MDLTSLVEIDSLKKGSLGGVQVYVHNDHRWLLPIIHHAQESGYLRNPCTLVMFDLHHDAKDPEDLEEICEIRSSGVGLEALINLCQEHLSRLDDDWLKAGMELGLIGDAVIFGVEHRLGLGNGNRFEDHLGGHHRIIDLPFLPGGALGHQGGLGDLARRNEMSDLWEILDWEPTPYAEPAFGRDGNKIALDFDLDCFVIQWKDYLLPWPNEIFKKEFHTVSDYRFTKGWSGRKFIDLLVSRAGLLTFAHEPNNCGDDEKADVVFGRVNEYLFDGQIRI